KIEVRSIVPQSMNAHTFEPTPRQRESLKTARIWFRIGEPFERPLIPVFPQGGQIIDLRDGIELLDFPGGGCQHCAADSKDRHIWLSPSLAKLQAQMIAKAFEQEFPEHRELFANNLEELLKDLDALDKSIHA